MYDINFYLKTNELRKRIIAGQMNGISSEALFQKLESDRNPNPFVFNIETTNNCNMTCQMCPRTSLMKRKVRNLSDEDYKQVLKQVQHHDEHDLKKFWDFVKDEYKIQASHRHEDSFYFYIVSKCLILHGYGEPILDPKIIKRVKACSDRNIPTYFSCVAANINVKKMAGLMEAGLDVIKFAMDSLTDEGQKDIRGKHNNFSQSFNTILEVLDSKKRNPDFKTKIVLTMLSFSENDEDIKEQKEFMDLWNKYPVYSYIKSQDNRWYFKGDDNYQNRSHYERQFCEFPWTSLSVMSNGSVVPCTQDYDAEMDMGNIREQSLKDIWNSEKYAEFRRAHITGNFPKTSKCRDRCDLPKLYQKISA